MLRIWTRTQAYCYSGGNQSLQSLSLIAFQEVFTKYFCKVYLATSVKPDPELVIHIIFMTLPLLMNFSQRHVDVFDSLLKEQELLYRQLSYVSLSPDFYLFSNLFPYILTNRLDNVILYYQAEFKVSVKLVYIHTDQMLVRVQLTFAVFIGGTPSM